MLDTLANISVIAGQLLAAISVDIVAKRWLRCLLSIGQVLTDRCLLNMVPYLLPMAGTVCKDFFFNYCFDPNRVGFIKLNMPWKPSNR